MGSINYRRVLLGGVVAGLVIWFLESAASGLYANQMQSILRGYGLNIEVTPMLWVLSVSIALLVGIALVFFYALARPRLGPGATSAMQVAVALWVGGYVPSLVGFEMIGLYPRSLLAIWGAVGLMEMVIASIIGAWLYRENVPAVP